jgi:dihydropteroate synthase
MKIGVVPVGERHATKVIGVINASPESFYKASVRTGGREIAAAARQMQRDGAHIIDIGAISTAPYLKTVIPVKEEIRRMKIAVRAIKGACNLPISADTPRAAVAEAAIAAGADAVNDVTGLKYDSKMAEVAAKAGVPVIAGAYSRTIATGRLAGTLKALKESTTIAKKAGVKGVVVDPSIGFFREEGKNPFFTKMTDMPWYARDLEVLSSLKKLAALGPVCVSVSRKSFIGHLLNVQGDDRLVPSLVCEVVAVMNGASMIRTHGVRETVRALTMLQLLKP